MKKIGIMTFHDAKSHGALLQAYALQTTIEKSRYSCEIINYDRKYLYNSNSVSQVSPIGIIKAKIIKLTVLIYESINKSNNKLLQERINKFRKDYYHIGKTEYKTIEQLKENPPYYDSYVVGSDQVWNPDAINHEAFYFTFLDYGKNTIAYAPSIGVSEIENTYIRNTMAMYLTHIKHLSCREKDGKAVLEAITGRSVIQVIDPTLLLTRDEWHKIASSTDTPRHPYVLCYFLGSMKYGRKWAKKIASLMGLNIIIIPQNPVEILCFEKKESAVSPCEFLDLFLNAEIIFTDSFHGTAFSVNFNKNFYSFCRRNPSGKSSRISRLKNFLESVHLEDRLIMQYDTIKVENINIDYSIPNSRLDVERKKSCKYLYDALNNKSEVR